MIPHLPLCCLEVSHLTRRPVHVLSSLPEQGSLVSSRTRTKISAASGSPVAGPTCCRRHPWANVVRRASPPSHRPSRSRQTAKVAGTVPSSPRTSATLTSSTSSTVFGAPGAFVVVRAPLFPRFAFFWGCLLGLRLFLPLVWLVCHELLLIQPQTRPPFDRIVPRVSFHYGGFGSGTTGKETMRRSCLCVFSPRALLPHLHRIWSKVSPRPSLPNLQDVPTLATKNRI